MKIDIEARVEAARNNFLSGYNCAQSVVLAYNDLLGMDERLAATVSASFGGGMGRMRESVRYGKRHVAARRIHISCRRSHEYVTAQGQLRLSAELRREFPQGERRHSMSRASGVAGGILGATALGAHCGVLSPPPLRRLRSLGGTYRRRVSRGTRVEGNGQQNERSLLAADSFRRYSFSRRRLSDGLSAAYSIMMRLPTLIRGRTRRGMAALVTHALRLIGIADRIVRARRRMHRSPRGV